MALTPEQIDMLADKYIIDIYQQMEREVIADIARRVKKTGRYTETAELMAKAMVEQGFSAARIQAEVLRYLRADKEYQMEVAENTKAYKQEIQDIIEETVRKAKEAGKKLIAEAGNMSWNNDLSMWEEHGADLTKPNTMSQLIKALQLQTVNELKNLTRSTGFRNTVLGTTGVLNAYQREMDLATLKLASGTWSYDQAVNDCVKRLAESGLRSIDYESGRSYQLDTAARMCVRTGTSQLAGKITEMNLESTGVDLVITSQHIGSRPEHVPWQNKVFSYSGKNKKYPDFRTGTGYGTAGGLKGVNCTHDFHPFWEGIDTVPEDIKEPEPVTVDGKQYNYYQATQRQRKMERDIRATKREIEAQKAIDGDQEILKELRARLRRQKEEYYDFSDKVDIRAKDNRLRVATGTSDLKKTEAWKKSSGGKEVSEYLVRSHTPGANITKERLVVNEAVSSVPENIQSILKGETIIDVGKSGASQYDYDSGILYIAAGSSKEEVIHEIGHLVENKMLNKDKVAELRKKIVGQVSPLDIKSEVYYDASGNPRDAYFLIRDAFVSEYQGRIYTKNILDAFESDGTFKDDLLWEFVAEPFREYILDPDDFKAKFPEYYEMLKEAVE